MSDDNDTKPKEGPKLLFPCNGKTYDWDKELAGLSNKVKRTNLLKEQHDFQNPPEGKRPKIPKNYIRCQCNDALLKQPRFVVREFKGGEVDVYRIAHYPGASSLHSDKCACKNVSLYFESAPKVKTAPGSEADSAATEQKKRVGGADFAAIFGRVSDPELREASKRTSAERPNGLSRRKGTQRESVSIGSLAEYLFQRSGVCDYGPKLRGVRTQRVVNGLVLAAIERSIAETKGNKWTRLIHRIVGDDAGPYRIIPWSMIKGDYVPASGMIRNGRVGFGFVSDVSQLSEYGTRELYIDGNDRTPVLLSKRILHDDGEAAPYLTPRRSNPVWAIFTVDQFPKRGSTELQWKANSIDCFQMSRRALFPIDSDNEDAMVARLIDENRRFRRWLVKPPGVSFIPDFQLLDTKLRHFIEVAGLMHIPSYREQIEGKEDKLGERIKVWDTTESLASFKLPRPEK